MLYSKKIFSFLFFCFLLNSCTESNLLKESTSIIKSPENEVMYHVFQRSFYDSNGDQIGDLKGLAQKLGYLQDLGITSILLLPLYESIYYHNYFSSDFEKIDSTLGTKEDYLNLVKEVHRRGMKIYMDMETQYVTQGHKWFRDAYKNPSSAYSDYISWDDSAQTIPSSIVYNLRSFTGYNGDSTIITTVNLNSEKVKEYNYKLFKYWTDPNEDGDFSDGVDGFRLDHMMDDLDNKGRWTNLFENFWKPLISEIKLVNPKVVFMAEQANWGSLGLEYLEKSGVDRVFAFRLAFEIRNFNKSAIAKMADSTFGFIPKGKNQIVFLENHDMPRFASVVKQDPAKLKVGAALNLLIGGIPSIYYGQELGMTGISKFGHWGMTDANEIPVREAFEWYKSDRGKGMAFWYKNSGPWWDSSNVKPNDGISLEEEKSDSNSLWHFYKKMIHLRKTNFTLINGIYKNLPNNNDSVFTFLRIDHNKAAVVAINLSRNPVDVEINFSASQINTTKNIKQLWGNDMPVVKGEVWRLGIPEYAINVWEISDISK
jgi:glycosidase